MGCPRDPEIEILRLLSDAASMDHGHTLLSDRSRMTDVSSIDGCPHGCPYP